MDWEVRRFAEIDSTNRYLLDEARAGAAEGLVAVADHQTAGRGRLDRRWEAPAGASLLCSILLRPARGPSHLVTAAVALAGADACAEVAGQRPALKWPNDLVLDDGKVAGVLAEAEAGAVVVGIGINLAWAPPGAAALGPVSRDAVLASLLGHLDCLYPNWEGIAARYREECVTVGRTVRVELAGSAFSGEAVALTDDGHLVVDVDGTSRVVTAGDVVHLR